VTVFCHVPVMSHCCTVVVPLHCTAPGVQATQAPFKQTGLVAGQAAQFGPQCAGSVFVLYAHGVAPPHVAKPALQFAPHAPPLHVATPLTAAGHCVQLAPQWFGSDPVVKQVPLQLVIGAGQAQLLD
jgi:hypothetical protein